MDPQEQVQQRSFAFFDAVQAALGDRLAERRIDPDQHLRVTVIDLTDEDIVAIGAAAEQHGVTGWVRTERADPADLTSWEQLRQDLLTLQRQKPPVLQWYSTPTPGYRRPPVEIGLYAHATAETAAASLHSAYGSFVALQVGALPYPLPANAQPSPAAHSVYDRIAADPVEMSIDLDGPLTIHRGHTITHHILLTNRSTREISVGTNGHITVILIDPQSGATVGGYCGPENLPFVPYSAAPSQTVRIPIRVGTASYQPNLGYRLPAGRWQITIPLEVADGRHLISPPMDITIID